MTLVERVAQRLKARGDLIVTAESCTGGWVAQELTAISGSSKWFERGFVTYSNEAKQEMLGVRAETLQKHGAVSEETAAEMARGALQNSRGTVALSITGIAGPGGGSSEKPVGLVHFGCAATEGETRHRRYVFEHANRHEVRMRSVKAALDLIEAQLEVTTRLA